MDCGRKMDYLRLSVTDRCNLRCVYCMPPEGIITRPHDEILTFEEIIRLTKIFASLGINKIRLTGGEPLVRKSIVNLVASLVKVKGVEEVSLTTNGARLSSYADELKSVGLKRINVSLDTLKEDRFKNITRNNTFYNVLDGIDRARRAGFYPIKLNVVAMKGINDDEILDFARFAFSEGLILRFIEFMNITPLWDREHFIPIEEVKRIFEAKYKLTKTESCGSGPAAYYKAEKEGIVGFINTSEDNCRRCNRLRLTSTGELKVCLYEAQGFYLRGLLRKEASDEKIKAIIKEKLEFKKGVDYKDGEASQLYMCKIGG